jgi:hypothetical protein
VPHKIADGGLFAGFLLLVFGVTMPGVNLSPASIILFVLGCLSIGAAIHLATKESSTDRSKPRPENPQVQSPQLPPAPPAVATVANPKRTTNVYYTRAEIDTMLSELVALQRYLKDRPQLIEISVLKFTPLVKGRVTPPIFSDYSALADELDQCAKQLSNDATELERLTKGADEYVKTAVSELPMGSAFDPLKDSLTRSARLLRDTATKMSDAGLAAMVIKEPQRETFENLQKYSDAMRSSKQQIADKITDLRSR